MIVMYLIQLILWHAVACAVDQKRREFWETFGKPHKKGNV